MKYVYCSNLIIVFVAVSSSFANRGPFNLVVFRLLDKELVLYRNKYATTRNSLLNDEYLSILNCMPTFEVKTDTSDLFSSFTPSISNEYEVGLLSMLCSNYCGPCHHCSLTFNSVGVQPLDRTSAGLSHVGIIA